MKNSVTSSSASQKEKTIDHDSRSETVAHKTKAKRISPAAKLLIMEYGLDASTLKASGPYGTLLKGDVLAAIKSGKASPKPASNEKASSFQSRQQDAASQESRSHLKQTDTFEDFPNSQIRKVCPINFQL